MKAKLLFLLIFVSLITNGQKYIELYKDHLPSKILQWDNESKEMINSQIEGKILLNPSLVSSFLEYLSKRYGENILNEDENLLNYNRALTAGQYKARNRWIENQIAEVRKEYPFSKSKDPVNRYLKSMLSTEMTTQVIKENVSYDRNLESYYSLIYLTNNPSLKYSPEEDYTKLVDSFMAETIKQIVDDIKVFKETKQGDKIILRERISSLWYTFDKTSSGLSSPYNKKAYDYLVEVFETSNKVQSSFEVNFVSSINTGSLQVKEKYYLPNLPDEITVAKNFFSVQYAVGFNLKFGLKKEKSLFNSVTLESSYNHSLLRTKEIVDQPYTGATVNPYYNLKKNESEFLLRSVSSVTGKVTTPVYYPVDYLSVDFGIMAVYSTYQYDWKGKYISEEFDPSGELLYTESKTFANNKRASTQLSILPLLEITFSYFDPISIKVSGNHKHAGVTFQVNLIPTLSEYLYEDQ
ncbi:MAG: hypothetical protein WC209_17680 [Ignavibacteriaceae bacterium]|jgi:hypothetical protein